jgi:hypothetical protein
VYDAKTRAVSQLSVLNTVQKSLGKGHQRAQLSVWISLDNKGRGRLDAIYAQQQYLLPVCRPRLG